MRTLIADGAPRSIAHSRRMAADFARDAVYAFFLRRSGAFVGYAGARIYSARPWPWRELLYALRPAFQRRGLATEMARAAIAAAPDRCPIASFTLHSNRASRRVLEKLGLKLAGAYRHQGVAHVWYRLPPTRQTALRNATALER